MGYAQTGGYGTGGAPQLASTGDPPAQKELAAGDPAHLEHNVSRLIHEGYKLDSEGRFGTRTSFQASEIVTDHPNELAKHFFNELGRGGKPVSVNTPNGKIEMRVFDGGSRIGLRPITRSSRMSGNDNPAVDITIKISSIRQNRYYKLHFHSKGE